MKCGQDDSGQTFALSWDYSMNVTKSHIKRVSYSSQQQQVTADAA
jgi:hypothetical protein